MGIFSSIKDAIFGKAAAQEAPATPAVDKGAVKAVEAAKQPAPVVDVEAILDAMPGADNLNWRTSIVDLMKLVGMDASYAERKELAGEMGDNDYSGTAEENIALHTKLMKHLAANGGHVPAKLLG
jgi:hypothetical protein